MLEASSQYMRLAVSEINGSNPVVAPVTDQNNFYFVGLPHPTAASRVGNVTGLYQCIVLVDEQTNYQK